MNGLYSPSGRMRIHIYIYIYRSWVFVFNGESGGFTLQVFADGSLYLTNVQLVHAGNYSCHAQKNADIVQIHMLHVHSEFALVREREKTILHTYVHNAC